MEEALLAALDQETDAALAGLMQAAISTLLMAGAPVAAPRWLALCAQVRSWRAGPAQQCMLRAIRMPAQLHPPVMAFKG